MKVYNTLSGQKEEFLPSGSEVKMYVCGVTPYSDCHIGHAMSYINFDVIRRYMEFQGYNVRHVQNFTDIDDKIINRANSLGISSRDLADKYIAQYFTSMDAINIKRAHVYPYATQEIPQIVEIVQALVNKGYAYHVNGDVYFRVTKRADYGKLSRRNLDDMVAGARVEPGSDKEHPMDFALWKASKPGEPSWPSPWGPGRPGWHIECSAMSYRYLGETLDIHGGGQDLIFPHHENEIAQSESFTGKPFVRFWMHNGLLQMGEEKMSKSLGNLVTVEEILQKFSPDALRLFVLSSHYRGPLNFSEAGLVAAERGLDRLRIAMEGMDTSGDAQMEVEYRKRFTDAMDDDFNSAQAIGVLFEMAREINKQKESRQAGSVKNLQSIMAGLASVLGLTLKKLEKTVDAQSIAAFLAEIKTKVTNIDTNLGLELFSQGKPQAGSSENIELLINLRNALRKAKQFALSDEIRSGLANRGIALEDTAQGTIWRHKG
ncbi:MAG: cysteinyl-tRNA synthetase [Dehalococcoidia bacterium]|nr:cysteinyl-tRNA synthetase [Dehalococcoidia bacterium]MBF8303695.1 cysteinyl-tRNA synthetase [Dehalococcoidia bacterium]